MQPRLPALDIFAPLALFEPFLLKMISVLPTEYLNHEGHKEHKGHQGFLMNPVCHLLHGVEKLDPEWQF
jgi:hypothetical protein